MDHIPRLVSRAWGQGRGSWASVRGGGVLPRQTLKATYVRLRYRTGTQRGLGRPSSKERGCILVGGLQNCRNLQGHEWRRPRSGIPHVADNDTASDHPTPRPKDIRHPMATSLH